LRGEDQETLDVTLEQAAAVLLDRLDDLLVLLGLGDRAAGEILLMRARAQKAREETISGQQESRGEEPVRHCVSRGKYRDSIRVRGKLCTSCARSVPAPARREKPFRTTGWSAREATEACRIGARCRRPVPKWQARHPAPGPSSRSVQ